MPLYVAQCEHLVEETDVFCKRCLKPVERIWSIDELGFDNALHLANVWNKNTKPKELYTQKILPYNREEYVFVKCAEWDDEHPNSDESTRQQAFKTIIANIIWEEYKRSCEDYKYYTTLAINRKHRDYVRI